MTTQTTTIQPSKPSARALIGTTVATLAMLGGALLWQARPASEAAAPEATAIIGTVNVRELDPAMFSDAEMYQRQQAAVRPEAALSEMAVFIVGSQAEATRVLETVAEANRVAAQFGTPPFNAQVVLAATAEEAVAAIWANADLNAYRAAMGLPPIQLIDQRTGGAMAWTPTTTSGCGLDSQAPAC